MALPVFLKKTTAGKQNQRMEDEEYEQVNVQKYEQVQEQVQVQECEQVLTFSAWNS